MDDNPYAPPKAKVGETISQGLPEAPSEARLYSQDQIALATFLGTPLVGGWLIAANDKTLARLEQANKAIAVGIGVTLVVLALAVVLPDSFPNIALPVVCAVAFRAWADSRFSAVLERHKANGGARYSWWRVVGLALLSTAIVFTLMFIVFMLLYTFGIELN